MKNHTHLHQSRAGIGAFEPLHPERFAAAQKSTWVSIAINLLLTCFQVADGFFAHSQALMADGLHSLSDFLADVPVLYANRHGSRQPAEQADILQAHCDELVRDDELLRAIHVHHSYAQS